MLDEQAVEITLIDFREGSSSPMKTVGLLQMLRSKMMNNSQQRLRDFLFRLLSTKYSKPTGENPLFRDREIDDSTPLPCCIIGENEILEICALASRYYETVPNIIRLNSPVSICGTIKGSFFSLDKIIDECKILDREKQTLNYHCNELLFLGGFSLTPFISGPYVMQRYAYFSVEVVLILYCLKLLMPEKVHLLRGSVENRWMHFGNFHDVCLKRFGEKSGKRVYNAISDIFLDLPLVSIVDDQVLCVNSGIPITAGLKEIEVEERRVGLESAEFTSCLSGCTMTEPEEIEGWKLKPLANELLFGPDITTKFLQDENLKMLICGKLLCNGTNLMHDEKVLCVSSFPINTMPGAIVHLEKNCKYRVFSFNA